MYRGMIEGAEWAKEGTYLREKIKQYQLDKVIGPRPHLAADATTASRAIARRRGC